MAHEFGHAIQSRAGDLDRDVPTIYTEQQADCFSGAWAHRVWKGAAVGVTFGDEDIRTGLIALVEVRDPIGTERPRARRPRLGLRPHRRLPGGLQRRRRQLRRADRQAAAAAAQRVRPQQDAVNDGNAGYGWGGGEIIFTSDRDQSGFWPAELATGRPMPTVSIRCGHRSAVESLRGPRRDAHVRRGLLRGDERGAVRRGVDAAVRRLRRLRRRLRHRLAWADAVQTAMGSQLRRGRAHLASDCLDGAWIGTAHPRLDSGATTDRNSGPVRVSPGDLDEAVQTALDAGDPRAQRRP